MLYIFSICYSYFRILFIRLLIYFIYFISYLLFLRYQLASIRGRLSLSSAPLWTSLDLHRFVAHYLTIRFPICLALNKIDAFPDNDNIGKNENDNIEKNENENLINGMNNGNKSNSNADDNKNQTICNGNHDNGKDRKYQIDGGRSIVRICQLQAVQRGELAVPVSAFAENWSILKQAYLQSQLLSDTKHVQSMPVPLYALDDIISTANEAVHMTTNTNTGADNAMDKPSSIMMNGTEINRKIENLNCKNEDGRNEKEENGKESGTKSTFPAVGSRLWEENEATLERVKKIWHTTGVYLIQYFGKKKDSRYRSQIVSTVLTKSH